MRVKIIDNRKQQEDIILRCNVCNVGMVDEDNMPYVLPFNFAYHDGVLYLHSAPTGKKNTILGNNPNVCVSFSTDHQMHHQNEGVACSYSMRYRSVLLYGKVEVIEDLEAKKEILNKIMAHYTNKDDFSYSLPALKNVSIFKIRAESIDGRAYGYD